MEARKTGVPQFHLWLDPGWPKHLPQGSTSQHHCTEDKTRLGIDSNDAQAVPGNLWIQSPGLIISSEQAGTCWLESFWYLVQNFIHIIL